jgi:hypothetical protein
LRIKIVPILYGERDFDAFGTFCDFVESVSYGSYKTCQVRGSNPCRGAKAKQENLRRPPVSPLVDPLKSAAETCTGASAYDKCGKVERRGTPHGKFPPSPLICFWSAFVLFVRRHQSVSAQKLASHRCWLEVFLNQRP